MRDTPSMEVTLLALAMFLLAVVLVIIGVAGLTERLSRRRWIGIRTAATQASDKAWRAGHRAAGGAIIAAAGPPLLLAVGLVARGPEAVEDWLLVYVVVGLVTGGLIALAVRQTDRAASDVSER